MLTRKHEVLAMAAVLLALGCNRENDRPMTPANGTANGMSPAAGTTYPSDSTTPGAADGMNHGSSMPGTGTPGADSTSTGTGPGTTGTGSGTTGSGSGTTDTDATGSGTPGGSTGATGGSR